MNFRCAGAEFERDPGAVGILAKISPVRRIRTTFLAQPPAICHATALSFQRADAFAKSAKWNRDCLEARTLKQLDAIQLLLGKRQVDVGHTAVAMSYDKSGAAKVAILRPGPDGQRERRPDDRHQGNRLSGVLYRIARQIGASWTRPSQHGVTTGQRLCRPIEDCRGSRCAACSDNRQGGTSQCWNGLHSGKGVIGEIGILVAEGAARVLETR